MGYCYACFCCVYTFFFEKITFGLIRRKAQCTKYQWEQTVSIHMDRHMQTEAGPRTQSTPPDPIVLYSKLGQYPDEARGWDSAFNRGPRRDEDPMQ